MRLKLNLKWCVQNCEEVLVKHFLAADQGFKNLFADDSRWFLQSVCFTFRFGKPFRSVLSSSFRSQFGLLAWPLLGYLWRCSNNQSQPKNFAINVDFRHTRAELCKEECWVTQNDWALNSWKKNKQQWEAEGQHWKTIRRKGKQENCEVTGWIWEQSISDQLLWTIKTHWHFSLLGFYSILWPRAG